MSVDPLLEPFQLGHLTLKNRIFSSSHAPGYNTDGTPNERYIAYHEEKAKGGIGLTMIGGSSNVSADSASLWGQLYFGSDAIIDPLSEMSDRIHRHGAAVMCPATIYDARRLCQSIWGPKAGRTQAIVRCQFLSDRRIGVTAARLWARTSLDILGKDQSLARDPDWSNQ